MEKVVALTVVAELPHDLEMHATGVFAFEESEPWEGWSSDDMAKMVGYVPGRTDGRVQRSGSSSDERECGVGCLYMRRTALSATG